MSQKSNKSFLKRLKVTSTGKLIGRKPGFNHFNAKQSRTKQLAGKKGVEFKIGNKERATLIPFNK
jgi:ribosomal protein L35